MIFKTDFDYMDTSEIIFNAKFLGANPADHTTNIQLAFHNNTDNEQWQEKEPIILIVNTDV